MSPSQNVGLPEVSTGNAPHQIVHVAAAHTAKRGWNITLLVLQEAEAVSDDGLDSVTVSVAGSSTGSLSML